MDSDPFCGPCPACAFGATEIATGVIPAQDCPNGPAGVYAMTWQGTGGNPCTNTFTLVIT